MVESVYVEVSVFSFLVIAFAVMCYIVAKKQDDIAALGRERDRLKSDNRELLKRPTHAEYKAACDERNKAQGTVASVTHQLNEATAEAQVQRDRANKLGDRPTSQALQKVTSARDAYKADNKKAGAQILELKERVGKLEKEAERLAEANRQLHTEKANLGNTVYEVKKERDNLSGRVATLEKEVADLEVEMTEKKDFISRQSDAMVELKASNTRLGREVGGYEHGKQQTAQKILRFLDAHDVDGETRKFLVGLTKTRKRKKGGA